MPDYPVPDDNLDGVTREELTRARIAKHKEILTPAVEPPVSREMVTRYFERLDTVLERMLADLDELLKLQKEARRQPDAVLDQTPGPRYARSGRGEEQHRNPEEDREGIRGGRQEGRRPTEG